MKKRFFFSMMLCLALYGCGKQTEKETADPAAQSETVQTEDTAAQETMAELAIGGEISGENTAGTAADSDPQAQADAYISDYLTQEQTLSFANLTGKDLAELRVSFSEGGLQDAELLQGSVLKDGAGVHYRIEELSELRGAEHLKLSVVALATDDTRMEFAAISIWDISATSIVLSEEDGSYIMYLE